MKIVFMGTPEFSVPSLQSLISNFDVACVFTQPDRPKGRGKKLAFSPVKEEALRHNIPVFQPEKIKKEMSYIDELKKIEPDFIIVVAYGQILSKEILDIPKVACINLHASLLPKYRGAAPLNFAIINGEKESGNTTMLMSEGLDEGDMLMTQKTDININMTAGELHDELMNTGGKLLIETINNFNNIIPVKQNSSLSTYASMLDKNMAKINWDKSAILIHNLVRGLNPWPIAYSYYGEETMKIYESEVLNETSSKPYGEIIYVGKEGMKVSTKEGILLIKKIQFSGKKPLTIDEYIRGNSLEVGKILK